MRAVLSSPDAGAMIQVISQLLLRGQNLTQSIEQPRITVRPGLDQVFVEGEEYYNIWVVFICSEFCVDVECKNILTSFSFFLFFSFQLKLFRQIISPSILIYIKKRGKNQIKATSTF